MNNKIRILLVDSDKEQVSSIEKYFSKDAVIDVVNVFDNGCNAYKYIKNYQENYDIILMDLLLPGRDGISIISEMRENNINKNIIVLTGYSSLEMIKQVSLFNINYFMLKPFSLDDLREQIFNIRKTKFNVLENDFDLRSDITTLLHSLGVPNHIKGFEYIREGIGLMYSNPSLLGAITKELYPEIAYKYNTTSSRVERAIRHAIEISWNRGDYEMMEEIFGHSVDFDRARPTNSEFIATLADRLKLNSK